MYKKTIIFILLFFIGISISAQTEIPSDEIVFQNFEDIDYISAPAISFDGKYLCFVVQKENKYLFFECLKDNSNWSQPVEIKEISNFIGENVYKNSPAYNYDGNKLYFEAMNGNNTDIFFVNRTQTGWSVPVPLPKIINSEKNEAEPSISPNDNILYFIRFEQEKEPDCGKIYYTKKNIKQQWENPTPLIVPLNSGCERTPRVLSDNKSLIFASKRNNEKVFSIYYTKNHYNDIWNIPKKIGELSKDDVLYPSVDMNATEIIFAIKPNPKKSKIFISKYPMEFKPEKNFIISGCITDTNNNPISAKIQLLNPISTATEGIYYNDAFSGNFVIFTQPDSKFILDFSADGYSHKYVYYNNSNYKKIIDTINVNLFNTVTLNLNVYDKEIFEPLNVDISIFDEQENKTINAEITEKNNGKYEIELNIGKKYNFTLKNEFSEPYEFDFDLTEAVIFDNFEKNIEIVSQKSEYLFNISDLQSGKPVDCEIILTNLSTSNKITYRAQTDSSGNVVIFFRKGDKYDVTINPQGYAFYNTTFEITDDKTQKQEIKLQALKQDVRIELNNITFETNSAEIRVESYKELDFVAKLLNDNPEIKVEISAHTDDIGSEEYNLLLSEKRANSVIEYLINKNIDKSKMVSQGYGETQPLVPNDSDENRAKNRRVEMKIIEVDY